MKPAAVLALVAVCVSCGNTGGAAAPRADAAVAGDVPAEREAGTPTEPRNTMDAPMTIDAPADAPAPDTGPRPDTGTLVFKPWPGTTVVTAVDREGELGMNVSGLAYLPRTSLRPATILALQNDPSRLLRLVQDGAIFIPDRTEGWANGKPLHYPDGKGAPDAEGVTLLPDSSIVYVASEQDLDHPGQSRLSVLRFDVHGAGAALTATHEWNLTGDLPRTDPNLGLEAIAWIPDYDLFDHRFLDESTGSPYEPGRYPEHGGGLFLVGLESNGTIYAYVLDHQAGTAHRVATFASGQPALMDLAYDRDTGDLWAACDDHCDGRLTVLGLDDGQGSPTQGRFVVRAGFSRPPTLPNTNDEGIALLPIGECYLGQRGFLWADDSAKDGHVLREGSIPCGAF